MKFRAFLSLFSAFFIFLPCCSKKNPVCSDNNLRFEDPTIKEELGEDNYLNIRKAYFSTFYPKNKMNINEKLPQNYINNEEPEYVDVKEDDFIFGEYFGEVLDGCVVSFAHKTLGYWWHDVGKSLLITEESDYYITSSSFGYKYLSFNEGNFSIAYESLREPIVFCSNNFYNLEEFCTLKKDELNNKNINLHPIKSSIRYTWELYKKSC